MANPRAVRVVGAVDVVDMTLIEKSNTGREVIMGFGEFGGATVSLSTQLDIDGETSAPTEFPGGTGVGSHMSDFAVEAACGFKNPLIVDVSGTTGTTNIFIKVVTAEAL